MLKELPPVHTGTAVVQHLRVLVLVLVLLQSLLRHLFPVLQQTFHATDALVLIHDEPFFLSTGALAMMTSHLPTTMHLSVPEYH